MSNGAKSVDVVTLIPTLNLECEIQADNLKCAKCNSILRDEYLLSSGCRFCYTCRDHMILIGQFYTGSSEECIETHLSTVIPDNNTNKSKSEVIVKCPKAGCLHECLLADVKHELVLKDEQMKTIMDEMRHLQNENKLINNEIISIKKEKEVLSNQVKILLEKLERKMDERREIYELGSDRITDIMGIIGANRETLEGEMKLVKEDIRLINRDVKSIKNDINSMKSKVQSIQLTAGQGQVDASYDEWLIDDDVGKKNWIIKKSDYFIGAVRPYKYQLASWHTDHGDELRIHLRIHTGPSDIRLTWPFHGSVTITVAGKSKPDTYRRQTQQCRIEKPSDSDYSCSDYFRFPHSELSAIGLDLGKGVCVSCQVVPGAKK